MTIEDVQILCLRLPFVESEIKWGHDLTFMIGRKMFCSLGLGAQPTSASFKVTEEEFDALSQQPGFRPAPYVAKYKWVMIEDISKMPKSSWEMYLRQSYELVKARLPLKIQKQLSI